MFAWDSAMEKLKTVRGTHDILPDDMRMHRLVVDTARRVAFTYGFHSMQTPIFETTAVFSRPLGETSDIVSKEMYSFADRNGDSITLRPEGTAGVVRAFIQNGLSQSGPFKVFYEGPMFRYERPQKGRQRQFHQFGIEALGVVHPHMDVDILAMAYDILTALGVADGVALHINSLGDSESRNAYRRALVEYLTPYAGDLSEDSKQRLHKNPLRIVDSKNPSDRQILEDAPKLGDYLNAPSAAHYRAVVDGLDSLGIGYVENPYLVRGMDYYCHTAFEYVTDSLGAQGTVIAGGRYDGLCAVMGGADTAGIGFAGGIERLCLMVAQHRQIGCERGAVTIAMGDVAQQHSLAIAHSLRSADIVCACTYAGNMKKRMKYADKINAKVAIIIGDDELQRGEVTIRNLDSGEQTAVPFGQITAVVKRILGH